MSTLPAAPPIKYVLGYRSRSLNPNLITDPNRNPKINKKTKRHRNEIEHRVISKSRFCTDEGGFVRGLQPETEVKHIRTVPTSSRSTCWAVIQLSRLLSILRTTARLIYGARRCDHVTSLSTGCLFLFQTRLPLSVTMLSVLPRCCIPKISKSVVFFTELFKKKQKGRF